MEGKKNIMNWLRMLQLGRIAYAAEMCECAPLRIPILFVHGVIVVVNGAQVHFTSFLVQISATEREAVSNDAQSNAREAFIPKTLPASCGA